ncbi:unnamed protein product [Leptosia nina]|uniref:Uncharacterized protein n=1 Tax=Leptosia nina TaxID=320188 RepID=A0AAV1JZ30_9NEOP
MPHQSGSPLKRRKSRELRGGILYTDCYCLRRNGLQYDCRRSGCQDSELCQVLPAPLCGPAHTACIKHRSNPHAEPLFSICKMRKNNTACSPCGPMVCYKYEDCGPPLQCLPRSAFKRNGLQDCQFFQQGSIRYLCREGPSCPKPCPPPCPPCVRRPPPGKTYKGRSDDATPQTEEGSAEKKDEKENQLKRTKSRELRGGIMYYSCHCIKRNGLQHDCRRTGCGGEPSCLVLPDPLCAPSQLARARGLADPTPLAEHYRAQGGGAGAGVSTAPSGSTSGGKRFIVCELKGIVPDMQTDKSSKCCKCPPSLGTLSRNPAYVRPDAPSMFVFDEKTLEGLISRFNSEDVKPSDDTLVIGPGGRPRRPKVEAPKEICSRAGCVHWKPPPPCVWNAPCKADCFEAAPGIRPGRNPLAGGGSNVQGSNKADDKIKILTLVQ